MTETIETGLVYIYRQSPAKEFIGCGALIEGSYIATCRHVWHDATEDNAETPVAIEYPHSYQDGHTFTTTAVLVDLCERTDRPSPDLVLLKPASIPPGVIALQLAADDYHETGPGYAHAWLVRVDPDGHESFEDVFVDGDIKPRRNSRELRQFTGNNQQSYWFCRGSSDSPLFLNKAQQLAGLLSLSELGANERKSSLHEAFLVPGTMVRQYVVRRAAEPVAEQADVDPQKLQPVLDALGIQDLSIADIPARLAQAIAEMRARAAEPVPQSNDGSDIDAAIGASREKLRAADTKGARELLQAKIDEEKTERARRLLPL